MDYEEIIRKNLRLGRIADVENALNESKNLPSRLIVLKCVLRVFNVEIRNNVTYNVSHYFKDFGRLEEHFTRLKLLVRRLEFEFPYEEQLELYHYCKDNNVSCYLISSILLVNIFQRRKVCLQLIDMWSQMGEADSKDVEYFKVVQQYLEGQQDE